MAHMFKQIHVTDFQSVADASVDLGARESGGGLTLIVGPSSTGKSATLRAVKMLTVNGPNIPVRVGAKKTRVEVTRDDASSVAVERGKSLSTYWLNGSAYQKAGTSVPKDVENFLGLYKDAHFAFQFDSPYLLNAPGSAVTQTLGEVTNAHVLTEAVREGIRRKAEANTIAKTRTADVLEAKARLEEHRALPARMQALESLEKTQKALGDAVEEARALGGTIDLYERLQAEKRAVEGEKSTLPDMDDVLESIRKHLRAVEKIGALVEEYDAATEAHRKAGLEEADARTAASDLEAEKQALLHEMGVCPTCGKSQ